MPVVEVQSLRAEMQMRNAQLVPSYSRLLGPVTIDSAMTGLSGGSHLISQPDSAQRNWAPLRQPKADQQEPAAEHQTEYHTLRGGQWVKKRTKR